MLNFLSMVESMVSMVQGKASSMVRYGSLSARIQTCDGYLEGDGRRFLQAMGERFVLLIVC